VTRLVDVLLGCAVLAAVLCVGAAYLVFTLKEGR
jgi:hypothetical protein